ncbi:hypothetical protein [Burkholderia sp. BCC1640]|uniref:hypothetical protein n=1 Tax=Burkholderia sp. BCC1640 TaxID=2676294 RepID=UPI00158CA515|nr:hypothetical protein [Burkholderia sp. BCC1640]
MANNNFKPFATAGAANVMAQADYESLAALLTGFQSGTAQSQQLNKVWRQSSIMAAVLAQFIVDLTGQDAIDDGTTATLLANLKMAVQAQSAAVIGQARNVSMSVTAASSSATLSADEIVVGTALGGQKYLLKQFSKTINLATAGAGGMDTGSAPVSGYVALYAIYNPTTGTSALLAKNATSAVQPNVYSGANMPAGYTASALISVWPTNSSGQLVIGYQTDRLISLPYASIANTSSQIAALTALSISSFVPPNARSVSGFMNIASSNSSNSSVNIASSASAIGQQQSSCSGTSAGGLLASSSFNSLALLTSQTVYWSASSASGTFTSAAIFMSAYTI